jgi:uncharacterized membrane protein YphA (DoxX/SURF4 family)
MAVSRERSDWALLLLRLAVGGVAILQGLGPVLRFGGGITMAHAVRLGLGILEMVCGGLMVIGVWMTPAMFGLLAIMGWPLAREWMHGGRILGDVPGLFRFAATLAAGLGGPGKWSPSK